MYKIDMTMYVTFPESKRPCIPNQRNKVTSSSSRFLCLYKKNGLGVSHNGSFFYLTNYFHGNHYLPYTTAKTIKFLLKLFKLFDFLGEDLLISGILCNFATKKP